MNELAQDVRYSLRMLARTPVVTAVAVISLALGIGANTAIFSLLNALVLRSLPVRDPGQLVRLRTTVKPQNSDEYEGLSLAMYQQLRRDQRVFSDLFVWSGGGISNLEANGVKYAASASTVSGEYFQALGIQPSLGRFITPGDLNMDSGYPNPVAVIGYGCWQRRYGGDSNVLGKTIRIEQRPLTIVGVMPEHFSGLLIDGGTDVTIPIGYSGRTTYRDRKSLGFDVYGRLRPGVTIDKARAQLESLWPGVLAGAIPEEFVGQKRDLFMAHRLTVDSIAKGDSFLRRRYTRPLDVLMAMVGLLLLIACVNLANLMLARVAGRRQEFGIRLALGAARWRLVRLVLTESLILSVTGAALGLAVGFWASSLAAMTMSRGLIPLGFDATPDLQVLAFTACVSVLTGLLFGVSPAWNIFHIEPAGGLRHNRGVRGASGQLGKALISAQVALSIVLVIGAVVFVRSLDKLRSVDAGFQKDGLVIMQLFPQSGPQGQEMPNRAAYYHDLVERLEQLPGVKSASYSHVGPVHRADLTEAASTSSSQRMPVQAVWEAVGPGFFHLAGMRVFAGREFDWRDDEKSRPVAIISESLSRQLFPLGDGVGKTLDFGERKGLEIVGVVNSASLWAPRSKEPMAAYIALMQWPDYNESNLDVRVTGNLATVLPSVHRVIESMGRQYALRTETVEQRADFFLATDRMIALVSSLFGGLALLLAAIGLFGLMSYAVSRRTAEIGVRMALGARPASMRVLILKDFLWLVLAGLAIGIPIALAAARLVTGMVFGVAVNDSLTIVLSSLILLAVAAIASYFPARRASRIDPMTALRLE